MLSAIVWLIAFAVYCLSVSYIDDGPKYWEDLIEETRKASVYDLPEGVDLFTIDRYVKEHILPSERYYTLRKELENAGRFSDFVLIFPLIMVVANIFLYFRETYGFFIAVLSCGIGIGVCCLIWWTLRRLYRKKWKVKEMYVDVSYLNWQLELLEDIFGVGIEKARQNEVTLRYYEYCEEIKDCMRKRIALIPVVELAGFFSFVLLFSVLL